MIKYLTFKEAIVLISIEELKELANRLKFDMSEEEYKTLQGEFEVILKQMDLIGKIKGLDSVEPMTFPYEVKAYFVREDEAEEGMKVEDIMSNVKDKVGNLVKVPKVIEQ